MGWIHKRHMQQGGSLNQNPKNNGSQSGPLRKIVGMGVLYTVHVCEPGRSLMDWRSWSEVLQTGDSKKAHECQREAMEAGRAAAEVQIRKSPPMELLECGHLQSPKSDIIGETQPVRRRCRKCKRGAPADVEVKP